MRTDVAIVGGGLAGLVAARSLNQAGAKFILLEARERLGGRILSAGADGEPSDDGFDPGPSWFWPDMQPALNALVRDVDLALFAQRDDGDILFELGRGQAPQRYKPTLSEPAAMRLAGASSTLIRALARSLPANRIRLDTRVTRVALTPEGAELATHDGGLIGVKQAILAAPPRLLEEAVQFWPALDPPTAELWRGIPTWMAPHAKVFALYDRPFWRDAGLSGAARSTVGPLVEIARKAGSAAGDAVGLTIEVRLALDQRVDHVGSTYHGPLHPRCAAA